MNQSIKHIQTYYDSHIAGKIKGFVEGNKRVERAWKTIEQWTPNNPQRILEVGCGIGDICWRMTRKWPNSVVVGLDVSPKSIEVAKKLFTCPQLHFVEGQLSKNTLSSQFDLIILMDVYEHIAVEDRAKLHEALKEVCSDCGRIILSFPTPRKQLNLRQYYPAQIQPIDEDINFSTIVNLASDIQTEVFLYQEVDVWHEGDYAHAVLGKREGLVTVAYPANGGVKRRICKFLQSKTQPLVPSRRQRLALVHERLGSEAYPNKSNI